MRNNRDAFDDKEPPEGAWRRIERAVFPGRALWNSVALWRAAAALFLVLSIGLLLYPQVRNAGDKVALKEFHDVEQFYTQQISQKFHLINQFAPGVGVNGFTHDFQQLEAMYQVLKEEMKTSPSQKVKDALVLNLQVRIDLLNKHLGELEQMNDEKAEKERTPLNAS